jgi:hypothetical protein
MDKINKKNKNKKDKINKNSFHEITAYILWKKQNMM